MAVARQARAFNRWDDRHPAGYRRESGHLSTAIRTKARVWVSYLSYCRGDLFIQWRCFECGNKPLQWQGFRRTGENRSTEKIDTHQIKALLKPILQKICAKT